MSVAPSPSDIFERAVDEGERRLDQSLVELVATSFIAGFTVVFGMVALGIVEGLVEPVSAELAPIAGALAFAPGVVFLIVGRSELFNENFFDPVAKAVEADSWMLRPLVRLWVVTFVLNLVGGGVMVGVFSIEGALSPATAEALRHTATDIAGKAPLAAFADAVAGGALVSLLSYLLLAVDSVGSRIPLAYVVGFLLALGSFEHVIVSVLHLLLGLAFDAQFGVWAVATTTVVVTAGNFVGGLGLVGLTHIAQAMGAEEG
ncbi:formate/nitrite transporter family protein [Candidatus Halobonum tyrrellensis]|uniref:Formate/nitrite transporter n=1 Tax=Candidatus Halobonum tyrrellensis G22 TaxID=1324957 RepID=V4HL06_9EURY|nr:formate/nitrite transporter family protein [Candidatus Halobonum tyrrellensis]ESP88609.1 formate/nitrite transporter [Candidatus Halobonum tyrrellensis G22]